MLYLLDANVLITANNTYYPVDSVAEYWDWLQHHAEQDNLKMPLEIFEEVKDGPNGTTDLLFGWIQTAPVKKALVFNEKVNGALVQNVITEGYAPNLTDTEIEQMGRDPFLVAYAMVDPANRMVVTSEASKPRLTRQNRRLPDVCRTMGVRSCDAFALNRALQFSTKWKK